MLPYSWAQFYNDSYSRLEFGADGRRGFLLLSHDSLSDSKGERHPIKTVVIQG